MMLAALTGVLWIASVSFLNPATENLEVARTIPDNVYSNSLETCLSKASSLGKGAEALGMEVKTVWCSQYDVNENTTLKEHEIWFHVPSGEPK